MLDTVAMASVGRRFLSVDLRGSEASMKERLGTIMKSGKRTKTSIFTSVTLALILCVSAVLLGACMTGNVSAPSSAEGQQTQNTLSPSPSSLPSPSPSASAPAEATGDAKDEQDVRVLVENFGKVLKNVSLLAPDADIIKSMEANYAEYVTPDLLANWEANPSVRAAGRLTSSPWPDCIEISSVEKSADGSYSVTGTLIEVTSAEAQSGSVASTRSVEIKAVLSGGKWLISECFFGYAVPANKN